METEIGYINGMNLGIGFNRATNDIHPSPALDGVDVYRDLPNANGQEVLFRVELVSSTESIMEKLNVSARASLKYGITGSGSARTNFSSLFKQNSYSIYVVVQVIVTNKQTLLDMSKVTLKQEAAKMYKNDPESFLKQYGDSFIYGLITGGEFIGVLEITSKTASELNEIRAAISGKASVGLWSGNASASFEQAMQKITSDYQMKATVYRQGGIGALNPVEPDQLIKDALQFPSTVAGEHGFPRSVLVIPYNHIEIPNIEEDKVASISSLQESSLEQLGALYKKFLKYQNDLMHALDHTEQFPDIEIDKVNERFNEIREQINSIQKVARECFTNSNKCNIPEIDLSLLKNIIPLQIRKIYDLGTTWLEQESGWIGVWTRRGLSNVFDAKWAKPGENDVYSVLTIYRDGNTVMIVRRDTVDYTLTSCTYTGTIEEGKNTISGTYQCSWVKDPLEWKATINY
ncbi:MULTISPECIES: hypothetical protein [Clostridium]|uniref:hypothetical protein n=1 Tax=Clostridium TaxID=1485 RepID=UPI00090CC505|nr:MULTISPECIES: hypothetical protein [Clostridium]APF25236.1 hypothetical protein NPD7_4054 [Clostridium sporogenes]MBD5640497.1 hypothetical protein [Clostridium botulinum]MDI6918904.1 hypothetical protein [Clostridium botulinum]WMU99574.1 hypothetical protein QA656_19790 [Clostridium botulinum]